MLEDHRVRRDWRDQCEQTPLFYAAEKRHDAIVNLLLDKGVDVHSKDNWDANPLSDAAREEQKQVVGLILGTLDVEVDSTYYRSPSHTLPRMATRLLYNYSWVLKS